jgi:hypothetical protein
MRLSGHSALSVRFGHLDGCELTPWARLWPGTREALGVRLAARPSQTLGGLGISPDTLLRVSSLLDEAPWVARNSTRRQSLR